MNKKDYPSIQETVYSAVLSNGLSIDIIPKPGYQRKYAFFTTNYGGADRRFKVGDEWYDTPAGVAHFLEHKMFDTKDGDALVMLSASGASPNAWTSEGQTAYYFDCTEKFEENLRLLLSFVSVPYFTEQSVAKEQGIIGQEIRMVEDSPDFVVYTELMKLLYRHHPIRDSVAGTIESIAEITPETLYSCHSVFYNPCNMALCVVGDVDPEMVIQAAKEILPAKKGEKPERDYGGAEDAFPIQKRCARCMEVSMPIFTIGAKVPLAEGRELLRQKLMISLALDCLVGESTPFYVSLYEAGVINDQFYADFDDAAGVAVLTFGGESAEPEKVFSALLAAAKELTENFDNERFLRLKKAAFGQLLRSLGSFEGLCRSMTSGKFGGYDFMEAFELLPQIEAEEIRRFLADTVTDEKLAMSVVNPKEG